MKKKSVLLWTKSMKLLLCLFFSPQQLVNVSSFVTIWPLSELFMHYDLLSFQTQRNKHKNNLHAYVWVKDIQDSSAQFCRILIQSTSIILHNILFLNFRITKITIIAETIERHNSSNTSFLSYLLHLLLPI